LAAGMLMLCPLLSAEDDNVILSADTLIEILDPTSVSDSEQASREINRGVAGVRHGGTATPSATQIISHQTNTESRATEATRSKSLKLQGRVDNFTILVEGHTDSRGDSASNMVLSQARANAVRAFLVINHDVEKSIVEAIGLGEDQPVAPNATDQGRRMNRRVVIQVMGG